MTSMTVANLRSENVLGSTAVSAVAFGVPPEAFSRGASGIMAGKRPVWVAHASGVLVAAFCGVELFLTVRLAPNPSRCGQCLGQ